jgi:hypothetical protein
MNNGLSSKSTAFLKKVLRKVSPTWRNEFELLEYTRSRIVPIPPSRPDTVSVVPLTMLGARGIDFHAEEQLARLASWTAPRYQTLFRELRADPALRIGAHNGYYMTPDAETYAAMILDRRPRRIVEVGAGYSTLIARRTIRHAGYNTKLVAIDPMPRTEVQSAADELILRAVEQSDLVHDDWSAEDILFIDSSHVCRTRGDLPYLYCQLLPALPPGVLVHIHDIFIPFDYPNLHDQWCHTEEYLLYCMLAYSNRYHTVQATHWLTREHLEPMRAAFGSTVGDEAAFHYFGSSFWFEVRA